MAVELEALRLGRSLQPVEMRRRGSAIPSSGSNCIVSSRSLIAAFIVGSTRQRTSASPIARAAPLFLNPRHDTQSHRSCSPPPCSIASPAAAQPIDPKVQARIDRILKATPLIDGHNDLAEQLRENYGLKGRRPRQRHRPLAAQAADDRHGAAPRGPRRRRNSGRSTSPPKSPATPRSARRSSRSTSSSGWSKPIRTISSWPAPPTTSSASTRAARSPR